MLEARVAPAHSIVFISDPSHPADVPAGMGPDLVSATGSCIVVGTLAEMDGLTTIQLAGAFDSPEGRLVFSGDLATPGRRVSISDSAGEDILAMDVPATTTRISVWANDPSEPDLIMVRAG